MVAVAKRIVSPGPVQAVSEILCQKQNAKNEKSRDRTQVVEHLGSNPINT
jgi:hypothetical protein